MPCTYDDSHERAAAAQAMREEFGRTTALLCKMCQLHEGSLPPDVAAWWEAHQAADRKREAEEAERATRELKDAEARAAKAMRELEETRKRVGKRR